jgi:hypothetical protein
MAIFLVAAVTASSLVVAALLVRELRLTDNMRQSLTAYYGAESGLESALYEYYKAGGITTLDGQVGDVSSWNLTVAPSTTEMVVSSLPWEKTKEIPLYDLETFASLNVQTIKIAWNEDSPFSLTPPMDLEWTFLTLRNEKKGAETYLQPGPRGVAVKKGIKSCAGLASITLDLKNDLNIILNPADRHILRFKHINGTSPYPNVTFTVTMQDDKGQEVAFNQETALKITGTALPDAMVSRALAVSIPRKAPAYDVFDYVIYSDTFVGKDFSSGLVVPTVTIKPPGPTVVPTITPGPTSVPTVTVKPSVTK